MLSPRMLIDAVAPRELVEETDRRSSASMQARHRSTINEKHGDCITGAHDDAHGLGGAGQSYLHEFPHDRGSREADDLWNEARTAQR